MNNRYNLELTNKRNKDGNTNSRVSTLIFKCYASCTLYMKARLLSGGLVNKAFFHDDRVNKPYNWCEVNKHLFTRQSGG